MYEPARENASDPALILVIANRNHVQSGEPTIVRLRLAGGMRVVLPTSQYCRGSDLDRLSMPTTVDMDPIAPFFKMRDETTS